MFASFLILLKTHKLISFKKFFSNQFKDYLQLNELAMKMKSFTSFLLFIAVFFSINFMVFSGVYHPLEMPKFCRGKNEIYYHEQYCEPTCDNLNPNYCHYLSSRRCFCKPGFVRDALKNCVPRCLCDKSCYYPRKFPDYCANQSSLWYWKNGTNSAGLAINDFGVNLMLKIGAFLVNYWVFLFWINIFKY